MAATGFVLDQRFTRHDTGAGHPERAQRIETLISTVNEEPGLRQIAPRLATSDEIVLVHDGGHFEAVAGTSGEERGAFDGDTPFSADSFETACLAAGGVLTLIDEVMAGSLDNGFAMVRPPGHHAERARAMGFCLFNNIAIGASYLRRQYGLEKVLIVDWDVHHGNGTQNAFYDDPGVLFMSTHRYPFYPGTGALEETGAGAGAGFTVNVPLPGACGDADYAEIFEAVIEPIASAYEPEFVLISAGFDPHARDPLGGMAVTEAGFARMAKKLIRIARRCCEGRCVAVLEGGYDLAAIRDSSLAVLGELRSGGEENVAPLAGESRVSDIVAAVRRTHGDQWST